MKLFLLLSILILASCSSLKFKYGSERTPAATSENLVAKIELSLKEDQIFPSGVDSTFVIVKLYDREGNQVSNILPNELTLLSSEDLEAKPFSLKQGIYKAEIKPRLKSKNIKLQIDWLGRIASQVVELKTYFAPIKDELNPDNDTILEQSFQGELDYSRGEIFFERFMIENMGDNKIINSTRFPYSQRIFTFEYRQHARQNILLQVDDIPNETVSHGMHSIFMFFPRKNLPYVESNDKTLVVNLPNGEKLMFSSESKEIVGGVFTEGPLDNTPDRFKRHFADLSYQGKGVVLRVNARGQSPELGQFENTKIDMNYGVKGSADVLIMNGTTGQRCRRPKIDFWEPIDVNPILFKFPTDEEFDKYLKEKCGFGLPKL